MQTKAKPAKAARDTADKTAVESDGRRQRSNRSRDQIVRAMIELVRAGEMQPAAARVARCCRG